MTTDELIEQKLKELQDIKKVIDKYEMVKEVKPGEPLTYTTPREVLEYSLLTDTEQIYLLEHQLLLDKKYPHVIKLGEKRKIVEQKIANLQREIKTTKELMKGIG